MLVAWRLRQLRLVQWRLRILRKLWILQRLWFVWRLRFMRWMLRLRQLPVCVVRFVRPVLLLLGLPFRH